MLECSLPSQLLEQFFSAPRGFRAGGGEPTAPLWGLMDGKRTHEIQEIWELCVRGPHGAVCGGGGGGARDCRRAQAKGLSTRTWVLLPGSLLLQMGLWSGGHRPPSWQQESGGLVGSPCWSGEREPGHFCGARWLRVHRASPPDPGRQLRVAPVAVVSGPRLPQMQTQREEVSAKAPSW